MNLEIVALIVRLESIEHDMKKLPQSDYLETTRYCVGLVRKVLRSNKVTCDNTKLMGAYLRTAEIQIRRYEYEYEQAES